MSLNESVIDHPLGRTPFLTLLIAGKEASATRGKGREEMAVLLRPAGRNHPAKSVMLRQTVPAMDHASPVAARHSKEINFSLESGTEKSKTSGLAGS
jgi:hypothetical protein